METISSSKLFIPIVMTGMETVLEDSASVSDWNACLSDVKNSLVDNYEGFGLCPSSKTLFVASPVV